MRKVIYAMGGVSLDGYIAGPDGSFDWTAPDDEVHRFHNEQTRELGVHLLGRKLYETMAVWETDDWQSDDSQSGGDPALAAAGREFAAIWRELPKVVFSTTLDEVVGRTRLLRGDPAGELERLRAEPGGDIGVGGAGLASELARRGLIDEYRVFVLPVLAGGGTPFFAPLDAPVKLELLETHTFTSRVVYLRYART